MKQSDLSIHLYKDLLTSIKRRIKEAQIKASLSVNSEMILMYYDIGRIILEKQNVEGWGAGVIPKLSKDISNELPELKGFSERNIGYMIRFAKEYDKNLILQQPVAKLPWSHNIILMEKIKETSIRLWYMEETLQNGWSRETLTQMIKSEAHKRQGKIDSNFKTTLTQSQSDLA